MKSILFAFLASLTFTAAMAAPATPTTTTATVSQLPWYQVELVVFTHLTAKNMNSEMWSANPIDASQHPSGITRLNLNQDVAAQPLQGLEFIPPIASLQWIKRLSVHPNYYVLLHLSWAQNFAQPIPPLHLYGGMAYADSGDVTAIDNNEHLPYDSQLHWQLDGNLSIQLKRYFNIHNNLYLTFNKDAIQSYTDAQHQYLLNAPIVQFHITNRRRTRSKELNYIDSPLLGMLIKITKLDQPPAPATAQANSTVQAQATQNTPAPKLAAPNHV